MESVSGVNSGRRREAMLRKITVLSKIRNWLTKIFLNELTELVVEGKSEEGSFQARFKDGEYDFKPVIAVSHPALKNWVFNSQRRRKVVKLHVPKRKGIPIGLDVYIASRPKIECVGWDGKKFCKSISINAKKISRFESFWRNLASRPAR
ncbi:hypothetical protein HQ403_00695 [Candidatus Kaiserbacteria bacterium]|nr:hypothetical protein [Candidatus Kaiserbacteria bacterium]